MDTDEARLVFQKYDEMMKLLHDYCTHVYTNWTSQVDVDCKFNLDQPLLLRDKEKNVLRVNFNKQVMHFLFHAVCQVTCCLFTASCVTTLLHPVLKARGSVAGGEIPHYSRRGSHSRQCSRCLWKV